MNRPTSRKCEDFETGGRGIGRGRPCSKAPQRPADIAIPAVTSDEIRRVRLYAVSPNIRFHYRYVAADLAWEAAKSLPANHPLLARLYNTAGQWISERDPKAADRFYQAMVRRCAKTPKAGRPMRSDGF